MNIYKDPSIAADLPPSSLGLASWNAIVDARTLGDEEWPLKNPVWNELRSGQIHEQEFELFRYYRDARMFVDIGANCGQSIASFRVVNKNTPITSFEPSSYAFPIASAFAKEANATVHNFGIGSEDRKIKVYVPFIDGLIVTPLATAHSEMFADGAHMRHFVEGFSEGQPFALLEDTCEIRAVGLPETFELCKIDVEGSELEVVAGIRPAIERNKPLVLIERGGSNGAYSIFSEIGYKPYRFSLKETHAGYQREVVPLLKALDFSAPPPEGIPDNIVYVHDDKKDDARRRGIYFDLK